MSLQHGGRGRVWKPGPRANALIGRALDLILPPELLDQPGATQSRGLSSEAWSKISFIAEPLCDGCGQRVLLITNRTG